MKARVLSLVVLAGSMALAATAFADGDTANVARLRTAASNAPHDASAQIALGRALRVAGETNEALVQLQRASAMGSAETRLLAHREIARTLIARREFERAMSECKAIAYLPASTARDASHVCVAEAHLLWRRASEALVETNAVLAHDSRNYDAKVAEGLAYALELQTDRAESSLRDAIAIDPDRVSAHLELGRLLARTPGASKDHALTELRRASSLDASNPDAAYELARALPPGAEQTSLLEVAVNERPTFANAYRALADAELEANHFDLAKAAATNALRAEPNDATSHLTVGRVLLAQNDPDGAMTAARDALQIVGNSAAAKLLIADAYAKKGEIDLAVENYQAAYGLDHEDPTPLVHASQACLRAGRTTSAKAFGRKATSEFSSWGPAWIALGNALAADKEVGEARDAYQSAKKARGVDASSVDQKLDSLR
jgi:tetratricopeptide (TPR) repeat protein